MRADTGRLKRCVECGLDDGRVRQCVQDVVRQLLAVGQVIHDSLAVTVFETEQHDLKVVALDVLVHATLF